MDQYLLLALIITRVFQPIRGRLSGTVWVQYRRATQTYSTVTLHVLQLVRSLPVGFVRANSSIRCGAVRLTGRVRLGTGGVPSRTGRRMAGVWVRRVMPSGCCTVYWLPKLSSSPPPTPSSTRWWWHPASCYYCFCPHVVGFWTLYPPATLLHLHFFTANMETR